MRGDGRRRNRDDDLQVVGPPDLFEEFYTKEVKAVLALALGLTRRRWEAEDVTQEAFYRAFREWDRVGHMDHRGAWVRRVALNLAVGRWRRMRAEARAALRLGIPASSEPPDPVSVRFWAAVREVWPETRVQRDWCHKMANVLDKLPKRLQARAKRLLREAMYAESRQHATEAVEAFAEEFQAKYPKAVECLREDEERLCAHFDFPAEHWKHLRTTNVIESPFSTVRLRQRVTKGAGSRTKALLMAFKLLDMAQQRWRRLDGAELLPLVRAGVKFVDGVREEREKEKRSERKKAA